MNVLILGSNGFLGSHIEKQLSALVPDINISHTSSRLECDCSSKESLLDLNRDKYDYIFHCVNYFKAYDFGSIADE